MMRHLLDEAISSTAGTLDLGAKAARAVGQVFRHLAVAIRVAGERRRLAALDTRMLKDIGLSRSMAHRESSRDFFDIPKAREPRRH